jgi:hypothetical protein
LWSEFLAPYSLAQESAAIGLKMVMGFEGKFSLGEACTFSSFAVCQGS